MQQLSFLWQERDHTQAYEKEFQDIKTKDGSEYRRCWPNAGEWLVLDKTSTIIPDADVTHVRLNFQENAHLIKNNPDKS